jgi:hypothetical protein
MMRILIVSELIAQQVFDWTLAAVAQSPCFRSALPYNDYLLLQRGH